MTRHQYDDLDHDIVLALRRGADAAEEAIIAHYTKGMSRAYHLGLALKRADEFAAHAQTLRDAMARADAGEAAAQRAREMNAELPADQRVVLELKGAI